MHLNLVLKLGVGPCDFSVSPSPVGLDFGTSDLGLTISVPELELMLEARYGEMQKYRDLPSSLCIFYELIFA